MLSEVHAGYSPEVNAASMAHFHLALTDTRLGNSDHLNMARPETEIWYLHEWFETQGMIQRDLITKLDWLPAKAHKIWHGVQPPKLHEAAEIAGLLNIRTHELLMPPEDAMRIRRIEATLAEVAKPTEPASPPVRTAAPAAQKIGRGA